MTPPSHPPLRSYELQSTADTGYTPIIASVFIPTCDV